MEHNVEIGEILDNKYVLVRKLGEGGFGCVYLARDTLLETNYVALKYLKIHDRERQKILIREMDFLAGLDEPHVVRFYHHFEQKDALFLAMEYCSDGSLRQLIQTEGRITPAKATGWAIEICETLQHVHAHKIVHHDLKPENILFTLDGTAKIADFGVANTRGGTPVYMAPELFLPSERVSRIDARVDIYALGVTLLEMLIGHNPFFRLSNGELLAAKMRPNFGTDHLPEWLKEILLKALHPKPELRFQTMREFKEALESRHVPYVFNLKRIQAHKAAMKAAWNLSRRRYLTTLKICEQALHQDPNCLHALTTAGKCELLLKRIERAEVFFEKAVNLNPRLNIQKELGWIYLEKSRFPEAISTLHDHLQRDATDYEAYNLLIKAFYETGRYEAAMDLIEIVLKDYRENDCFENNLIICCMLLGDLSNALSLVRNKSNPFFIYNWGVFKERPVPWSSENGGTLKSKLIFQDFRHGQNCRRKNTVIVEVEGCDNLKLTNPIICLGRSAENDVPFHEMEVSRRHCAIINFSGDVWLYNLGSTQGTYLDDVRVERPVFLDRRCHLVIGNSALAVLPKEGILL